MEIAQITTMNQLRSAMLEFWKRKEKRVALEWGMVGFETGENVLRPHPITHQA